MEAKRRGSTPRRVVVAGDVTIDWNLARTKSVGSDGAIWNASDEARLCGQRGGAALLADLLAATLAPRVADRRALELHGPPAPDAASLRRDPQFHHSFALWSLHPYAAEGPGPREPAAWRVEAFLGLDRAATPSALGRRPAAADPASADLVVLDDAGFGFRDRPAAWPRALRERRARWVLLKMAQPVAKGGLWEALSPIAERVVTVLTVNDLRRSEVQISRELSWERTAQDLAWELVHNVRVNSLVRSAHVVVSLDTVGALLMSNRSATGGSVECTLFFDPLQTEGSWNAAHPGGMVGYTSCLTAALARQLLLAPEAPDLALGIQRGLTAMRALHREGYGKRGERASQVELVFPFDTVTAELTGTERPFAVVEIRDPMRRALASGSWTILEGRYPHGLELLAEEIVRRGPEAAISDVPIGRFGDLVTVDRQEIESFRGIRALIAQYLASGTKKETKQAPLSIAVFGAPGSGKSFGVIQVAMSLASRLSDRPLTFNLSQLRSPAELLDAFHQVRDVGLRGLVPLVFWDEFDTALDRQPLGWLAHFLAPMQDGEFQQGQVTHPIGRAIFVFAGGTKSNLRDFSHREGDDLVDFKRVKGPDFVSRIKGFVDVLGPNPRGGDAAADPFFAVRRAILLRSLLRRRHPELFQRRDGVELLQIDSGVSRALLRIGRYEHGARSMESIVAMSQLAGRRAFERSSLPTEVQLDLHVDGREFLSLVQRIELEGELLERLAEAVHEVFCDKLRARGLRRGAYTNERRKLHSALVPFAELPADEREQNRGNARDIPNKLAAAGYVMLPARSNAPPFSFPGPDLDRLAEMEHERWMNAKLAAEWRWARTTDKAKRLHRDLLPWVRLADEERERRFGTVATAVGRGALSQAAKEKDRDLVRDIPRILARIGFTVVPTQSGRA